MFLARVELGVRVARSSSIEICLYVSGYGAFIDSVLPNKSAVTKKRPTRYCRYVSFGNF